MAAVAVVGRTAAAAVAAAVAAVAAAVVVGHDDHCRGRAVTATARAFSLIDEFADCADVEESTCFWWAGVGNGSSSLLGGGCTSFRSVGGFGGLGGGIPAGPALIEGAAKTLTSIICKHNGCSRVKQNVIIYLFIPIFIIYKRHIYNYFTIKNN